MFPLDKNTIQQITTILVFLSISYYLFISFRHSITMSVSKNISKFLRFKEDGEIEENGINANDLKRTFMASAFSLASAIYVYVEWASYDGLFALWSPITWALGIYILYKLTTKIYEVGRSSWTLHSFLGDYFDNEKTTKISSLVTSSVFLLQVAAEVVVGIAVLKAFIGPEISITYLSIVVGTIFIIYSLIGGLPSVLVTDNLQYRLVLLSLFAIFLIAINEGGATGYNHLLESLPTFLPSGTNWIIVLSLLALNFPLLFTDMSVWQRISASKSVKEAKEGSKKFFWSLLFWMSAIVIFGTAFSSSFTDVDTVRPAIRMISFFSDSIAYPFLITGFIAALLSTADTFLISSVQTIIADWKYREALKSVNYNSSNLDENTHKRMIKDSRIGTLVFGIVSVAIGILTWFYLGKLLELLFVIFGIQTSLAPAVLYSLFKKEAHIAKQASFYSILVGALFAIIGLILSFYNLTIMGIAVSLWTPLISLLLSSVTFLLFIRRTNG